METTQIREQIHTYLDGLSSERLGTVLEFLASLSEQESNEATEELLAIPNFKSDLKEAEAQADNGELVDWRLVRDDVGSYTTQRIEYPLVDQTLLEQIVKQMLTVGSPIKIIMFGSRARGEARTDSDIDLLVIENSEVPRYKRASRYYVALKDILPPQDIVVWTPDEANEWNDVPNAFVTTALREGKLLYQAK